MRWLSPTITQYFQARNIWGTEYHAWTSGAPVNSTLPGQYSGVDSPASGTKYTVAWFAYFRVETRAYAKNDENPNDSNIYLQIKITTVHNKLWTSNTNAADGFIDIGLIAFDASRAAPSYTEQSGIYLHNQDSAKNQLYTWAGISDSNIICGVVADNGYKTGQTVPGGTWGTHVNGVDTPVGTKTFTLVFSQNDFNEDGTLKESKRMMPFVHSTRYHKNEAGSMVDVTGLTLEPTLDINLEVDPFIYIPWAIMKSGKWESCNRRDDGLMVCKNGSFSKVVKNSIVSMVVNGKLPSTSNGFRVQGGKWEVSPITPDE